MKKLLIIMIAIMLVGSMFMLSSCKEEKVLIMYTESGFPPFEYTSGTQVVGVDVEIAKAIAEELGWKLVIKDVAFDSIIAGLTEDNAIGAAGITITQLRAQAVDFSVAYYGDAIQYVIYANGALTLDEELMVSADQLKNKNLGVQTGTTGDILATEEKGAGKLFEGATVKQYENALIASQDIGGGCDYVIIDRLTAMQIVANSTGLSCSQIAGLDAEEYGIAVKKGNTELLEVVNRVIQRLLDEGKIDQWLADHAASVEG